MNPQHRRIRIMLNSMAPKRAVDYIKSFGLRPDEESVLIECDVNGLSYVQVSEKLHLSPDAIKERKRRAYSKIADEINNKREQGADK